MTAGVGILVLAAIAFGVYQFAQKPGNVSHPNASFVAPKPKLRVVKPQPVFVWPRYGYTLNHDRFYNAPRRLRPPFRLVWQARGASLLEFPPVLKGNYLYQLTDGGTLRKINKNTGHLVWKRSLGHLAASTPAIEGTTLYATLLERSRGGSGRVYAIDARSGRTVWDKNLPSRSESSPLVYNGVVYFGSENGTVYALRARDGKTRWTYSASGAVKGSPTFSHGTLYFGDYGGEVQAVSVRTGKRIWSTGTNGGRFGRSGTFYSTAAIAFGRVYIGNTDGRMYSFVQSDGQLAWATGTGSYVYAGPAVADVPGLGPTVFAGSYDRNFYAFNARTGGIRWQFRAPGRISGAATIIGKVVYVADVDKRTTTGLDTRTGRVVFKYPQGGFDPAISDNKRLYITGYTNLLAFEPRVRSVPTRRHIQRRAAVQRPSGKR